MTKPEPTTGVLPHRQIAILQSNYLPWKGYFDIIHDVDLFVFYDDLQYTSRDWRNRNRIKSAQGSHWITVPVGTHRSRLICDVDVPDPSWQSRHWRTLTQCYGKCAHFKRYSEFFEHVYLGMRWTNLSTLNQHLIVRISQDFLGITTSFSDSREFELEGHKQDRLLDLVIKAGGQSYLSGPAGQNYIDPARFAARGIELRWKNYDHYPEYPQRFPPFEHGVSIIDLLFNTGPDAPWHIWGWRDEALRAGEPR